MPKIIQIGMRLHPAIHPSKTAIPNSGSGVRSVEAHRREWQMHVEGQQVLADLAIGRPGEEGMRRHYLALIKASAASMAELLVQATPSA